MKKNIVLLAVLLVVSVATGLIVRNRFEGPPTEIVVYNASSETITVSLGPDPLGQTLEPGKTESAPFTKGMTVKVWVGPKAGGLPGEWIIDDVRGVLEIMVDGGEVQLSASGLIVRAVEGS